MGNELFEIQQSLKCPKDQKISYKYKDKMGNWKEFYYMARSAERILSELKPILKQTQCSVTLSDEVICLGTGNNERFYIKSTATLFDKDANVIASKTALAREPDSKDAGDRRMNESQITGSTSSYARKYALCGLFGIDDGNDADYMQNDCGTPLSSGTPAAKPAPTAKTQTASAQPADKKAKSNLSSETQSKIDTLCKEIKERMGGENSDGWRTEGNGIRTEYKKVCFGNAKWSEVQDFVKKLQDKVDFLKNQKQGNTWDDDKLPF